MEAYLRTREKIAKNDVDFQEFSDVMRYRYETLGDTLSYIKQIWNMTKSYVNSAKSLFKDLSSEITNKSLDNLTLVTSMGVGASLIGLFDVTSFPAITPFSVGYFFGLALIGIGISKGLNYFSSRKKYAIAD
ncbi:MAG: hypothetical protein ACK5HP_01930 [Bacilli bacterium]